MWAGKASVLLSLSGFLLFSLISDKMFPALGFGAQLPPDWKVSGAGLFPFGQGGICLYDLSWICFGRGWGPSLPAFSGFTANLHSRPSLNFTQALGLEE